MLVRERDVGANITFSFLSIIVISTNISHQTQTLSDHFLCKIGFFLAHIWCIVGKSSHQLQGILANLIAEILVGNNTDAEAEARRALRIDAGAVEAHTLLGIILASRGNANTEAAESLSQAVALNPASFDAQLYLGRVQYAMKDYTGALKSLDAAVKINPKHAEARFFLGTVLELAGDSTRAMSEYQELLRLDPNSVMGQLGAGALLVKAGKLDEAMVALNKAVSLDPKEFEAHWALGRALALKERFAEAVEEFQRAIALVPSRADAHYQLGLALRRLGRTEEANREFAIVERLNAEFRSGTAPD